MADQDISIAPIMCNLSLADIIVQLHEKAIEATKSKFSNFEIVNSAIEGKKGSYKLVGAGQHIVTAVAKEGTVTKAEAKPALQTYVQWFVGPDLKSELKDDSIYELQTGEQNAIADEKSDSESSKNADQKNESISIATFYSYLKESSLISEENDDDDEDRTDDSAVDTIANSSDSNSSKSDKGTNDDNTDAKEEQTKNDAEPKSRGWYVAYELDIEGAKRRSTFKDSIKFLATGAKNVWKSLVEPISITFGSFSGTRTTKTIGDLDKAVGDLGAGFAAVFGKIDSSKLKAEFDKKLKQKLPQTSTTTEYFDNATIKKHLNKSLTSADQAKVNAARYSLCVKVPHDDVSQKVIGKGAIADIVTSSIQGMFKKFKNKVNPDDVILVNNYNGKDALSDKVNIRKESAPDDIYSRTLLAEDGKKEADHDTLKKLDDKLTELAESKLGNILQYAAVDTAKNIMSILEKANVKDDSLKSSLSESDYAFLIETEEDISEDSIENVNASNENISYRLQHLFETALFKTKSIDAVRSVFESLIAEFGDSIGKDVAIKKTALHDLKAYVSEEAATKNESIAHPLQYATSMFEQLFPEDELVFERSKRKNKKFYKAQAKTSQNTSSNNSDSADTSANDTKQDGNKTYPKKQKVFYAIPDENNLAYVSSSHMTDDNVDTSDRATKKQTFVFGYKDPKDPKKFIVVGKPSTVENIDDLSYRDLPVDADGNKALRWDPTEEQIQSNPDKYIGNPNYTRKDDKGNPQTKITAVFGNTVSQDNGKYDFYVIPMKGLKMSSE